MFKLVMRTFKRELISAIVMYCVSAILRLGFSVLILYLLNAVADGDLKMAYIYCAILIILWYFIQSTKHLASL